MIGAWKRALGAAMAFVSTTAVAKERAGPMDDPALSARPEIAVGAFDHGSNFHPLGDKLFAPATPAGVLYEGEEEYGTADIQLSYRSAPIRFVLKPRVTAKVQINTAGRTHFSSLGAEWRQHALGDRIYGQIGIGVTVHDGYRFTPDPFAPGISDAEARRRYDIYRRRTSWGSRVLFNPNAAIGVRLNRRWAAELAWEHFSHRRIFSDTNPGIDTLGIRLVRRLGR